MRKFEPIPHLEADEDPRAMIYALLEVPDKNKSKKKLTKKKYGKNRRKCHARASR